MEIKEADFRSAKVGYFSMEIGLIAEMPNYSGGLGILAGDFLKSAADLKVPIVGVSLLYKKGFFKQKLDENGNQSELDESWEYASFMKQLSKKVSVKIRDREVFISAWVYNLVGLENNILPIIFLDTDLPQNSEYDRQITSKLYGSEDEYRLSQEIVLGIGGSKMLDALGCKLERYHMNEGHSALLAIEVYKKFPKKDALESTRERCIFTTHTPVPAGHDKFERIQAEQMLHDHIPEEIREQLFYQGKLNMTYIGLRFSKHVNGVAKRHTEVSRKMFPEYEIKSITNGVYSSSWTSPFLQKIYDKYIPEWKQDPSTLRNIMSVPKEKIWIAHGEAKEKLFSLVKKKTGVKMDQKIFTIGFARRATGYKRADLLISDINRLKKIAKKFKGIQIVYSGKAHPKDEEGKNIIRNIFSKIDELKDKIKIVYLEDYNIEVAKLLVAGVDVWLNTPLRPNEASGTSGMKAAHNGVPHFSTLDGWWLEGHVENVTGWSIGLNPYESKEDSSGDAEDLYSKLEYIILPTYYFEREKWLSIMKHTIALNASFFNTHRMLQQYVLNFYFE